MDTDLTKSIVVTTKQAVYHSKSRSSCVLKMEACQGTKRPTNSTKKNKTIGLRVGAVNGENNDNKTESKSDKI